MYMENLSAYQHEETVKNKQKKSFGGKEPNINHKVQNTVTESLKIC